MSFRKSLSVACCVGAFAALFMGGAAHAGPVLPAGWSALLVDATINQGLNPITNIAVFVQTTTNTGRARFFTAVPGFNEFPAEVPPAAGVVQTGFAAGVIDGLPGDPADSSIDHLVIFGTFSAAELGEDFTTLFPGISESTIINDLLTIPANMPMPMSDVATFTGDATADGLYGGDGSSIDVVAFSTGTLIGTGRLSVIPAPEPMTLSLFGAGVAGAAFVRRARRKTA